MQSTKVIFVGNSGSGKSTIVNILSGNLPTQVPDEGARLNARLYKHIPTLGVEVHPIRNSTNTHVYKVWDCAGKEQFGGLREGYYTGATKVLIFDGGEELWAPQEWEQFVTNNVPGIQVHHVTGTLAEKHAQVLEILA